MAPEPRPAHLVGPGKALQAELDARGWTQKDLAEILGRPSQVINEIVRGSKQITPETSIQLGAAFKMSPEYWLRLESTFRLRRALQQPRLDDVTLRSRLYELAPIAELQRRQWLPKPPTLSALSDAVCQFLRISDPEKEPEVPIARLRHTATRNPESRSKIAWIRRAQSLVEEARVPSFDAATFKAHVGDIFNLARTADGVLAVPQLLAGLGIRVAFVPHLPKTYLDGATFWDDQGPVIVLSLRYDRLDYFWFTLGHELFHVLRRQKQGIIHEDRNSDPDEEAADTQASAWILDASALKMFLAKTANRPTRSDIEAFAATVDRHPSLVVGRLQHDAVLTWAQLRDVHVSVRGILARIIDAPFDQFTAAS